MPVFGEIFNASDAIYREIFLVAEAIAPVSIESSAAVGSPAVGAIVVPSGVESTASVGSPGVAALVAPSGVQSTTAVGIPTVQATVVSNAAVFGEIFNGADGVYLERFSVVAAAEISPAGIASVSAVGVPTFQAGVSVVVGPLAGHEHPSRKRQKQLVAPVLLMPVGIESVAKVGVPIVDVRFGKRRLLEQRNSDALMLLAA